MASELEAVQTKNIYDTAIKQINHIKVNLLKECYEYLLGRDILVSPVIRPKANSKKVYLPNA